MKTVLSTRGQVVIPRAIREQLNLKEGDEFKVEVSPNGILLKRNLPDWRSLQGSFGPFEQSSAEMFEEARREEREYEERKLAAFDRK